MTTIAKPMLQDRILVLLRSNAEGCTETDADGSTWQSVYLDNAKPAWISRRQFAGYLSALKRDGLYRPEGDDCFGMVKM